MARVDEALKELAARWAELPPETRAAAEEALTAATILIVEGVNALGTSAVAALQAPLVKVAAQAGSEVLLWGRPFDWVIERIEGQFPAAAKFVKELTGGR